MSIFDFNAENAASPQRTQRHGCPATPSNHSAAFCGDAALKSKKRGSALLIALWVIMVLGVFIMNFAVDARLQASVNVYVRNRTHVDNLTKAGVAIAETIMLNYNDVTEPPEDETIEDIQEKMEENKWLREERDLKFSSAVTTEPIELDWLDPEGGSVTISIKFMEAQGWNINNLYSGGDANYRTIWENIFSACGIPDDYWDELICSWNDWRDDDDSVSAQGEGVGGEQAYYRDELEYRDGEKHYKPRNGEITDLEELAKVKGFRDYPVVLTGGVINPEEKESDQIRVLPILDVLTVYGNNKIPVNAASRKVLLTVPGIGDPDDPEAASDIVDAILEMREEPDPDEKKSLSDDDYGHFKNFADLQNRLSEQIDAAAAQYLTFDTSSTSGNFDVAITGKKGDITHTIKAIARVEDGKIKYIRWQEDP
ncbi:MAG: general secretion pathway protein GspK [Kiritimatiellae bacterium]|nr:general secretion pathway protein GspK [Kiritimatiellia bacterium]